MSLFNNISRFLKFFFSERTVSTTPVVDTKPVEVKPKPVEVKPAPIQAQPVPDNKRQTEDKGKDNPFTIKDYVLYKNGVPVRQEITAMSGGNFQGARFIVNHYTANNSTEGTIGTFKTNKVSAHLVVGTDGEVVQMVKFNRKAWHAGVSSFISKWGSKYENLNSYSIGIEFVNYGYRRGDLKSNRWQPAKHKNEKNTRDWEAYTFEQLNVARYLNGAIAKAYGIPPEHIVGHDDISPTRKVDPGPLFPLQSIRDYVKVYTSK